jgi:hypothetical protein
LISSVLYRPLIVSANALSYELPTAPTAGWIPAYARRSLNRIDVYWADSTGRRYTLILRRCAMGALLPKRSATTYSR